MTNHRIIIGSAETMSELADESVHLVVTSPPYFNAPFDYKDLFSTYDHYLVMLEKVARELYRVLSRGRVVALNIDDMLVDGEKFPIVADATKIFQAAGFAYRDRIIWKKPDGYLRISRRSGVILQNPYPMYFYPDNLLESILFFQKGKFDYKQIDKETRELSRIDKTEFQNNKWYSTLWEMTNVLPNSTLEKNIAAFPIELPYRIIKLFSYKNEIVLDPFLGSATTMKVARQLGRNSVGIEIKEELLPIIKKKIGYSQTRILDGESDEFSITIRENPTELFTEANNIEGGINVLNIEATITGIKYRSYLSRDLKVYDVVDLEERIPRDTTFYLTIDGQKVAVSYWTSPKRTRTYPYPRVYDSLTFSGKKITVIPIMKEEGFEGDRDFIQWDTISLMSLLGVYVVVGYYKDASVSSRRDPTTGEVFSNKITKQLLDEKHVIERIRAILSYQSDALHWNLEEVDNLQEIGNKAIRSYERIFSKLGKKMHNIDRARERINKVMGDRDEFKAFSRELAKDAQHRESETIQPKEYVNSGEKATITIENYLGGKYYFTADEARVADDYIFLVEAKHNESYALPSLLDIKDGLLKMVLFSNLSHVKVRGREYEKHAVLKLTGAKVDLSEEESNILNKVKMEAENNNFGLTLNDTVIVSF